MLFPGSGDASISDPSLQEISRNDEYLIHGLGLLPAVPAAPFSEEVVKAGKENGHPMPGTVQSLLHTSPGCLLPASSPRPGRGSFPLHASYIKTDDVVCPPHLPRPVSAQRKQ